MGNDGEPVKVWAIVLCVVQICLYFILGVVLIFLYEFPRKKLEVEGEEVDDSAAKATEPQVLRRETWQAWGGALHPGWLLGIRVFAFLYLLGTMIFVYIERGSWLYFFNYYTEWTLVLLVVYFGWGTVVSIVEYLHNLRKHRGKTLDPENRDLQTGLLGEDGPQNDKAGFLGRTLQVLFQTAAPAVVLTDGIYWIFLFPLFPEDFPHTFSEFNLHALNAIFLAAELSLNSMRFPLFRAAYFFIYSSVYVFFQWYIHFAGIMDRPWPYPFMAVSTTVAPLWYFALGFSNILAYGISVMLNRMKLLLQSNDAYMSLTRWWRSWWGSLV